MTRYNLDPQNHARSVSVGYDNAAHEFYGYAFSHEHQLPILVDRREPADHGAAALSRIIDAVHPWSAPIPPGIVETLDGHRTHATRTGEETLRAIQLDIAGNLIERAHLASNGDKATFMRSQVGGWLDLVRLRHDLCAWLNEDGMYTAPPNIVGTHLLHELGASRQPYFGPVLFTAAKGPETVSLPELHAARVRHAHNVVTRTRTRPNG
jgi:hypothetical protein